MAEININELDELEELKDDYDIVIKTKSDILSEIDFNSEDDKLVCESIIDSLENTVFDSVKNGLTVSIPFIGCLRKDPIKEVIQANKEQFKNVRKISDKTKYKQYVSDFISNAKDEQKNKDRIKFVTNKIRQKNKKKYEEYYIKLGRSYAELFLKSIFWLEDIPFDAEVQEAYDNIK